MRTLRIGEGVPGVQGSGDCEDDMAAGARGAACALRCGSGAVSGLTRTRRREVPSAAHYRSVVDWTADLSVGLVWAELAG